ncbi:MAG: DUF4365 domain-containing protein [Pseudomonadota bacterium]|jgi:hypothetical protein|nr:DUF4365 domain-containing protein [Pseudomonadota bacterium]
MRKTDTQRTGQIGINVVERICIEELKGRWQPVDGHNDDGMDGLLFLEDSKGELTGQIIFIQVKCWKLDRKQNGTVRLSIKKDLLVDRVQRWRRVAGAMILVWVDPNSKEAFWADLEDDGSFDGNGVKIDLRQKFSASSLNRLRKMSGTIGSDNSLPLVNASRESIEYVRPEIQLRKAAKEKFKSIGFAKSPNDELSKVAFGRVGWKHITRNGRPLLRITQSMQLLGVAKDVIEQSTAARMVRRLEDISAPAELWAVDAKVVFPHRDAAVIRVIVLKQLPGPRTPEPKSWFYSVYERRRRRGIRGEHAK